MFAKNPSIFNLFTAILTIHHFSTHTNYLISNNNFTSLFYNIKNKISDSWHHNKLHIQTLPLYDYSHSSTNNIYFLLYFIVLIYQSSYTTSSHMLYKHRSILSSSSIVKEPDKISL